MIGGYIRGGVSDMGEAFLWAPDALLTILDFGLVKDNGSSKSIYSKGFYLLTIECYFWHKSEQGVGYSVG